MLDILLVTMSFIAAVSMMFLCWLAWTLNDQLQHNDNVINQLKDEIDMLRERNTERQTKINELSLSHKLAATMRDKYADNIKMKDDIIKSKRKKMDEIREELKNKQTKLTELRLKLKRETGHPN